jgi:ribonucleoside-diphosphate reductase alpha chain
LRLIQERGLDEEKTIDDIINNNGSVKDVDWLDELEKAVFLTAFEIDQNVIIRLAASRQRFISQSQSINLFFSSDESEDYISSVHQEAFRNPLIKSLYYIRSETGIKAKHPEEVVCSSCEG